MIIKFIMLIIITMTIGTTTHPNLQIHKPKKNQKVLKTQKIFY